MSDYEYSAPGKKIRKHSGVSTRIHGGLWWFQGFPALDESGAVLWTALQSKDSHLPITFRLTGQHISRAQRTLYTLRRDYWGALEKLTGDSEQWLASHTRRLEAIKQLLHTANLEPPPLPNRSAAAFAKVVRGIPELKPLADSLRWMLLEEESAFRSGLDLLQAAKRQFGAVMNGSGGHLRCLQLIRAAHTYGNEDVLPILDLLTDPGLARGIPLLPEVTANLMGWLKQEAVYLPPTPKVYDFAGSMRDWFEGLTLLSGSEARRRLAMLRSIGFRHAIKPLSTWWDAYDRLVADLTRLRRSDPAKAQLKGARRNIELLGSTPGFPTYRFFDDLIGAIIELSTPQRVEIHAEAMELLRCFPEEHEGIPIRAAIAIEWIELFHPHYSAGNKKIAALLRSIRKVIGGSKRRQSIAPWVISASRRWGGKWGADFQSAVLGCDLTMPNFDAAARYAIEIADLLAEKGKEWLVFDIGFALLHLGEPLETTIQIVRALVPRAQLSWALTLEDIKLIWQSVRNDSEQFVELYLGLDAATAEEKQENADAVRALLRYVRTSKQFELLEPLRGPESRMLALECGALLQLLQQLKADQPAYRGVAHPHQGRLSQNWLNCFPRELHESLQVLFGTDEENRAAAFRLVAPHVRNPEEIAEELERLEAVAVGNPVNVKHVNARIANLKRQQSEPPRLSPARIQSVKSKIARHALRQRMSVWREALSEECGKRLSADLEIAVTENLLQPGNIKLVAGILGLPAEHRRLGLELLKRLCGPLPPDFRDHPENCKFLTDVQKRGIDIDPWLDGLTPITHKLENSATRTLGFEADPFEILRMGSYFQTCLSIGAVNFFAAITNAVDINKRVIYERTEDGTVSGRALVALTDRGEIVVYPVFAHRDHQLVTSRIHAFVKNVAEAMRSQIVPGGKIRTLVAKKWYADPPDARAVSVSEPAEDGSIRSAIKSGDPAEIVQELKRLLKRSSSRHAAIENMLLLPELLHYPGAVLQIIPFVGSGRELSAQGIGYLSMHLVRSGVTVEISPELRARLMVNFQHVLLEEIASLQMLSWLGRANDEEQGIQFARAVLRSRRKHGNTTAIDMLCLEAIVFRQSGKDSQARRFAKRALELMDALHDYYVPEFRNVCLELCGPPQGRGPQ